MHAFALHIYECVYIIIYIYVCILYVCVCVYTVHFYLIRCEAFVVISANCIDNKVQCQSKN